VSNIAHRRVHNVKLPVTGKLVSHVKLRTWIEGVRGQGAVENIWT